MRYEMNWIRSMLQYVMGAYVGHGVGRVLIILSCRDGRKCFGLTRGKCQILKLIMPF